MNHVRRHGLWLGSALLVEGKYLNSYLFCLPLSHDVVAGRKISTALEAAQHLEVAQFLEVLFFSSQQQ